MRYIESEARVVWSASDLKAAAECEFAWLRALDAKLGRIPAVEEPEDEMLERAARLGDRHEEQVLERYREEFGPRVVEIARASSSDADAMAVALEATIAGLQDPDARIVFQAAFSTHEFVGFADFLKRDDDGRWRVQDSKLARRAKVTALMQLAAYVDQLDRLGIPRSDEVDLLLGDGTTSTHLVADLMPLFFVRRARLRALIADRRLDLGVVGDPIAWADPRGDLGVVACGRCATCEQEVVATRDVLLVAGMRPVQRERLRAAGIRTIDDLAAAEHGPQGMNPDTFAGLRTQARLQLASPAGVPDPSGESETAAPLYEVVLPEALATMPRPDLGDIFFDFEGDPLYTEPGAGADRWGIDYLFGWTDLQEQYTPLWAHTFAEEKEALERFCDFVAARRAAHPGMHIYHYAPYEPTHLAAMAARHGVREADVDRMLRDELFVDLYPIVRRALRVGSRSYSIKKLEPLYMGEEVRTQDVKQGGDSILRYVEARELLAAGDEPAARAILDDLADYNRYDCVSTRRLRDWLVERARETRMLPARPDELEAFTYEPSPLALALTARAADGDPDHPDAVALRLGAAAIDYYPRERKSFWQGHFQRLREPLSLWADTRDVIAIDAARARVLHDWDVPEGGRAVRRIVELRGDVAPGTRLKEGAQPFVLYGRPAPFQADASSRWIHVARSVEVVAELDDGVVVSETSIGGMTWDALPLAVTPAAPPQAGNQQKSIDAWAEALLASGGFPADPATDILRRRPPRTRGGALPAPEGDDVAAIVAAVRDLDRSYLAVQGPPGTGKTYVGSHVIAKLVTEHGFKVGVVAQSHAVVENMLDRVVGAGVPASLVGKALKSGAAGAEPSFTVIQKNGVPGFAAERPGGYVIGGTAWDFAHEARVPRGSLDLLVIDEAGQFSLASTIAVSLAATRLLLLGDPQQLPQVSQGTHPEPVDTSALGWVMDGEQVIPATHGYFLARSWRMHPAVSAAVSGLSYAGRLASHEPAALRAIEGVEPGLHVLPIRHHGNATESPEEAAEVVRIVREVVGRAFTDITIGDGGTASPCPPRALTPADVIVVAPYNAQVQCVEQALAEAGFGDVRVGTVDRFQGQEAAVSIVTLAASSGRDAPRGSDFLLLQNRLNVAVSRAMVAAYLIHSPALLDDLPRHADGVARMSAFARLVGADVAEQAAVGAPVT
ncbi:TM0106 family RecB-like putative nuclease [Microbacterium paludicola]|uniref:TM0106 family RecB-like putative nuclease n=1 Tax=Microbacterium paludicola TaxID=300019 RepID=A0A4Y9FW65_9MICO|nr:bifunctional RecB family nuclease/DEAD/DEAH box helicase [Microbacterium paludicola]MBF0816489.1 TM0106 family RecB-like putative nuclease [Microbacterium paludicola]TFU32798.1 TM0106 family RecB-like putative nuclease [Microbacterium paludicola]